jgi:CheY-like chemotaxis protein
MTQLLEVSISRRHTLNLRLADDLPAVEADPTQLRQVVMNLLLNASEAIGDRPGTISLTTDVMDLGRPELATALVGADAAAGRYAYLEVADTGCGMDTTTRQRIFDPFFSTKSPGRGLGLPAVFGIVRGHRGVIRLQSEPGGGTVFQVLLPVSSKPAARAEAPPAPVGTLVGGGTVLVVDDEPLVRRFAGAVLRHAGFTVLEAGDGEEALTVYDAHVAEIRAVLLDLTMPRLDGEATLRALRQRNAELPIILSSGFALDGPDQRAGLAAASAFLQKPYEVSALLHTVRTVVAGGAPPTSPPPDDPSPNREPH